MKNTLRLAMELVEFFDRLEEDGIRSLEQDFTEPFYSTVLEASFDLESLVAGFVPSSCEGEYGLAIYLSCREKEQTDFANGWLGSIVKRVLAGLQDPRETKYLTTLAIEREIRRAIIPDPIVISSFGDLLLEIIPEIKKDHEFPYFIDHAQDDQVFGYGPTGLHAGCGGVISRRATTQRLGKDVLVCGKCHFRGYFPLEVETRGELRACMVESIDEILGIQQVLT